MTIKPRPPGAGARQARAYETQNRIRGESWLNNANLRAMELSVAALARGQSYQHRGLSRRTIEALCNAGVDFPERLLFLSEREIVSLPGIGKAAQKEIHSYRERFMPSTVDTPAPTK